MNSNLRLVLMRHGESQSGTNRTVGGHRGCRGLTPKGVLQVQRSTHELIHAKVAVDQVFCSSLRRSRQSAYIAAEALGVPVASPSCLLCELHPGSIDAVRFSDLGRPLARYVDDQGIGSGGESPREFRERILALLGLLTKDYRGLSLLLVTHFGVIDAFVRLFGLALNLPGANNDVIWIEEGRSIIVEGNPSDGFSTLVM